jgi:hypothetical protein
VVRTTERKNFTDRVWLLISDENSKGVCRFAMDGLVEDQRKEKNGVPF